MLCGLPRRCRTGRVGDVCESQRDDKNPRQASQRFSIRRSARNSACNGLAAVVPTSADTAAAAVLQAIAMVW